MSNTQGGTVDSYVFKLKFITSNGREETRRYGFKGDLTKQQVFDGLYARAAQVFSLEKNTIHLLWTDTFNRQIRLNAYSTFLDEVAEITLANATQIKRDLKGRIELIFRVDQDVPITTTTATVKGKGKGSENSKKYTSATTTSVPEPTKRSPSTTNQSDPDLRKLQQFFEEVPLDVLTRFITKHQAQPKVTPSSTSAAPPTSTPATSSTATNAPQEPTQIYSGVKTIFNKFVGDLNRHLAENLGDSVFNAFDYQLPEEIPRATTDTAATPAISSFIIPSVSESIHPNCWCDNCIGTIAGVRHKCLDCANYDLCTKCIKGVRSNDIVLRNHPVHHTFGTIPSPGCEVIYPEEEEVVAPTTTPALPVLTPTPTPTPIVVEEEIVHPATCDLCDKTIKGIRHKCVNCPDFDSCSTCLLQISSLHPLHSFLPILNSNLTPILSQPGDHIIHKGIICDHCGTSPIVGIRYKCMDDQEESCRDFDLCGACEALPVQVHDRSHPLLKIRVPDHDKTRNATRQGRGFVNSLRQTSIPTPVASTSTSTSTPVSENNPLRAILLEQGGVVNNETDRLIETLKSEMGEEMKISLTQVIQENDGSKTVVVDILAQGGENGIERELRVDLPLVEKREIVPDEEEEEKELEVKALVEESSEESSSSSEEESSDEDDVEEKIIEVKAIEPVGPYFGSTFIKDITLIDGSIVPAGGLFSKVWSVRNSGNQDWPEATRIVNLDGFSQRYTSFEVPCARVGEIVEIQCDLKAPEDEGSYSDGWQLQLPSGAYFGNHLWVSIRVPNDDTSSHQLDSSSLSSSSLIAPSLNAAGKVARSPTPSQTSTTTTATSSARTDESLVDIEGAERVMSEEEEFESVHAEDEEGSVHDSDEITSSEEESSSEEEDEGESSSDEEDNGEEAEDEGDVQAAVAVFGEAEFVVLQGDEEEEESDEDWEARE